MKSESIAERIIPGRWTEKIRWLRLQIGFRLPSPEKLFLRASY
jgi:hypothetical protein